MKAPMIAYVDVAVVQTLKEKAHNQRVSFSALVNQVLSDAAGASQPIAIPRKLSKKAEIVLRGIRELHTLADRLDPADIRYHCREYRMDEVCKKVGLFPSSALPALRECERAGVLKCVRSPPLGMPDGLEMDHWRLTGDPEVTAG